ALALRIRVNMSAKGSVIMVSRASPTRLTQARNQTVGRHVTETDSADAELSIHGPCPTADLAPEANANHIPRFQFRIRRCLFVGLERFQLFLESCGLRSRGHLTFR